MVLMSSEEALKVYNEIKRNEPWWFIYPNLTEQIRYLWHDLDGNSAGLYISGPLIGKIAFYNHEYFDPSPVFRSVMTFYRSSLELVQSKRWGWDEMNNDYPVIGDITPADAAEDLAIALICLENWKETQHYHEMQGWGYCVMALMPPEETNRLFPFIDRHGFDSRKIMDLIAKRHFDPALTPLEDWLMRTLDNMASNGIRALGEIGSIKAGETILKLREPTSGYVTYLAATALQKCGYQVRRIDDGYEYLAPNETTWHKL